MASVFNQQQQQHPQQTPTTTTTCTSSGSSNPANINANAGDSAPRHHQRSKSSVIGSFFHRRNNSETDAQAEAPPSNFTSELFNPAGAALNAHEMLLNKPLGEIQQNQLDNSQAIRPLQKPCDGSRPNSKSGSGGLTAGFMLKKSGKDKSRFKDGGSPIKPKKIKSATNLGALLGKPKSFKNLKKSATDQDDRSQKDKENRTPTADSEDLASKPPIYAQFTSTVLANDDDTFTGPGSQRQPETGRKSRPMSYQHPQGSTERFDLPRPAYAAMGGGVNGRSSIDTGRRPEYGSANSSGSHRPHRGGRPISVAHPPPRQQSTTDLRIAKPGEPYIDPKEIDTHLEAMLDRRNIPENQRYKMRSLTDTVKMEFIRQDWAETAAAAGKSADGSDTSPGDITAPNGAAPNVDNNIERKDSKDGKKTTKSRTGLTLSRSKKSGKDSTPSSPTKRSGMGTLGRHFRSKSSDSIASGGDRPNSATSIGSAKNSSTSTGGALLAKVTGRKENTAADFVSYLRKTTKPEVVEVGKVHKLRLLLRNETVASTEDFIRQGGMKEIVGLLHRIMEVEWREEHEDALLHESLLCLKALCTVALGLQYLNEIEAVLFPALLKMLFDPEKKGPSEFTTRNIIISVLFTYIETSSSHQERVARAAKVLSYLRDPEPAEAQQPVPFVLNMRKDRPYRVWGKEVVSVTKEVFWIFLHNLNVVALPGEVKSKGTLDPAATARMNPSDQPLVAGSSLIFSTSDESAHAQYIATHFPKERPPVPAAPYIGGVEWDATNYLAAHMDLLNAIIACTPNPVGRNALREELRISGFERCLGGSMRLCKEKFYGAVHDGLRTWVAAAHVDAWDVRDVRYGPPPPDKGARSRSQSPVKKKKLPEPEPPRIEMPKLDFGLGGSRPGGEHTRSNEPWSS